MNVLVLARFPTSIDIYRTLITISTLNRVAYHCFVLYSEVFSITKEKTLVSRKHVIYGGNDSAANKVPLQKYKNWV